jgi:DNA-binding NarL/FixJ family response regulator
MSNLNPVKIAIVDDSLLVRCYLQEMLAGWGYQIVLKAVNGMDFFRQLTRDNAPDICITDLNMPVMNGYETIRLLKEGWPDIKVIAFSGAEGGREANSVSAPGADGFVSKLNAFSELQHALHEITYRTKQA